MICLYACPLNRRYYCFIACTPEPDSYGVTIGQLLVHPIQFPHPIFRFSMTNTQSKLFSTSRSKPNGVNGSLQQTILLASPHREAVRLLIQDKIIAALSFVNPDGVLQHQFGPVTLPGVDGTPPKISVGNSQDEAGCFAPFTINLDDSHFLARMCESDMDLLSLPKPQPIPQDVSEEHGLIGNHYLVAAPKYVPGHFGFEFPSGQLDEVDEQFESNGDGYMAWNQLTKSANTSEKQTVIKQIYRHPTIQASPDTYILNRPESISTSGPAMTVTLGNFSAYPNQMKELKKMMSFKDPSLAEAKPSSSAATTLTTGEDRQKDFISNRGLLKLTVQCVGGNVDFDNCTIDDASLVRPIETTSYSNIKAAPSGSRPDMFCDMVNHSINDIKKNGDSMNPLSHVSMQIFSLDASKLFLSGGFQTTMLTNMHDDKQLTSIGAATFMPQNLDEGLINKYAQAEVGERNTMNASIASSTPKKLRTALVNLEKMEDRSPGKCLINALASYRILFDFAAMERQGKSSIYSQVMMKVLNWLTTQIEQRNPEWIQATNDKMLHLKYVYFTVVDMMMVAFAKYGTSLHNLRVLEDPEGDLSKLDTSDIITFLRAFKSQRERFANLQAIVTPHKDKPIIAPVEIHPKPSLLPAATVSPPALAHQPKQQKQRLAEQQRAQKKQRIDPPVSAPRGEFAPGMIILYEGKSPEDAIPASLPICPEFVCKNHHCPNGKTCDKLHVSNLGVQLNARERTTWAKHMQQSKAGFFLFWKTKGINTDGPEWEGIIGNAQRSPPKRA